MEGAAEEVKQKKQQRRRRRKPAQQDAGSSSAAASSSELAAGSASELVATMMSDLRQAASAGSAKRSTQSLAPAPSPEPVPSREAEPSMNVAAQAFVPSGAHEAPKKNTRRSAKKNKPPSSTTPGSKAAAALEVLGGASSSAPAAGRGGRGGRAGAGRGRARRTNHYWWHKLEEIDPISMEPLSDLRYPPLQLFVDEEGTVEQWFDGRILASYLVSTGRFAHPSSRRELGPDECDKIDQYLLENNLGKAQVRQAWECRDQYDNVAPSGPAAHGHPAARLATLRREADSVLRALFGGVGPGSSAGPANGLSSLDRSSVRRAPATVHSGPSFGGSGQGASAFQLNGNLGVIDDDVVREHGSNADESSDAEYRSSFPSLGPASAPRPVIVPKRPPPAPAPEPEPVCTFQDSIVRAEFVEAGTLGVTLTTNPETQAIELTQIDEGTQAASMTCFVAERWRLHGGSPGAEQGLQAPPRSQRLVLRTVGAENVEGLNFTAVAELIKASGRPLLLTFRKPEMAAGAAALAQAAADMKAADAEGKGRLAALSDAFGMGKGKVGQLAAASAVDAFSESTLALARAQPELVREIESALDKFVASQFSFGAEMGRAPPASVAGSAAASSSIRRLALRPMPRWQREMVHEIAERYGLSTGSYGTEPNRRVDCFRSAKSAAPSVRLSEAAASGLSGTAGSSGVSRHAVSAANRGEATHILQLRGVEASRKKEAQSHLYQAHGECSVRWEEARDGSQTATVSFTHEAKLQEVAAQLGGGVRGLFSVAVIPDAPPVTPAPIVAAVGSWTTPKKTGSMPTAEALASARSGRWERLERLEAREAERCQVHFYRAREPGLVQRYSAGSREGDCDLVNYYRTVPSMVTYYRARASPAEVKQAAAQSEATMLRNGGGGSYVPPSRRGDGPSRLSRGSSLSDRVEFDRSGVQNRTVRLVYRPHARQCADL